MLSLKLSISAFTLISNRYTDNNTNISHFIVVQLLLMFADFVSQYYTLHIIDLPKSHEHINNDICH